MLRRSLLTFLLTAGIVFFMGNSSFSTDRVYWDETGDTIYVSSFPARVDLHMRFDTNDTLSAMVNPFTWAGSSAGVSLVVKNCDANHGGWFAGSAMNIFAWWICGAEGADKYQVSGLRFMNPHALVMPGTNLLLTVWTFNVTTENSTICMDSTFMSPSTRLKWVRWSEGGSGVFPTYTKKCWIIAKIPCGDANFDWIVDIVDMVYLIKYFFYNGPNPVGNSDVNSDGIVDIVDILYLGNYIFHGGEEPNCP